MNIDAQGWLLEARRQPSLNCDARPVGGLLTLLVVHNISLPPGQFGGDYIDALFCNRLNPADDPFFESIKGLKVSSHLLIRRDGEVVQYVPFQQRAWHAGVSSYQGRARCNDFSIGIELEGTDHLPYEEEQYRRLAAVIVILLRVYPSLSREALVGHCDIAPDRKTDPGAAFNWARLNALLDVALG
ncbi:MAG: 1,6-anhydro-N-acetylmuramyl-L-alanine amidase AmpD [Gammaproteobacteria bacterium]|nr:1,6-anhydro-N-acetylmuramyl-L-alanine amidase AmpD [Gammaproteobacteria bacterium]